MNKEILITRLKGLMWGAGNQVVAFSLAWLLNNLDIFNFSPEITVLVGLILTQITKYLNTK